MKTNPNEKPQANRKTTYMSNNGVEGGTSSINYDTRPYRVYMLNNIFRLT